MRACLELLIEGKVELPIAEVAGRSGVNRGTVYRWWPTQAALLDDAVSFHESHRMDAPNTGSWAGDVRVLIAQTADLAQDPTERAIMATVSTGRYPAFNELMMGWYWRALPHWFEMIGRAIGRGEVSPDVDPATVLSMMMSPAVTKSLFEGRAMTKQELEMLATLVCRATAPETETPPTPIARDAMSRIKGSAKASPRPTTKSAKPTTKSAKPGPKSTKRLHKSPKPTVSRKRARSS